MPTIAERIVRGFGDDGERADGRMIEDACRQAGARETRMQGALVFEFSDKSRVWRYPERWVVSSPPGFRMAPLLVIVAVAVGLALLALWAMG